MYKEHFFTKVLFKRKTYWGEYAPEKMERIYFGEISKYYLNFLSWDLSQPTFAENITFFNPSDEMDFEFE